MAKKKEQCVCADLKERVEIADAKARLEANPGSELGREHLLNIKEHKMPWIVRKFGQVWAKQVRQSYEEAVEAHNQVVTERWDSNGERAARLINKGLTAEEAIDLVWGEGHRCYRSYYLGRKSLRSNIDLTNPHARKESGI